MDHSSSQSTTQGTSEVPPKGAAGAGNRRGRPKKAKAAQERRPGGRRGAQGTQKGAQGHPKGTQGEAKGQSGHLLRPNVYALSVWEAESAKTLGRNNTQADHKGAKGSPGGKGAGHQKRPEDPRADRGEPRRAGPQELTLCVQLHSSQLTENYPGRPGMRCPAAASIATFWRWRHTLNVCHVLLMARAR